MTSDALFPSNPGVPNPWAADQYRSAALGAGPRSRRWEAGERARLHLPLPIACAPAPGPWKNCLPRNWSLVPTRLGTAVLIHSFFGTKSTKGRKKGKWEVEEREGDLNWTSFQLREWKVLLGERSGASGPTVVFQEGPRLDRPDLRGGSPLPAVSLSRGLWTLLRLC